MNMTNAQVALMAAVQSITPSDVWQGRESVKRDVVSRRVEYLEWLESTQAESGAS